MTPRKQTSELGFHSDEEHEDTIERSPSESEMLFQWLETADPNMMQHFRDETAASEEVSSILQPASV